MYLTRQPKNWLLIILLASLIVYMLTIIKHNKEEENLQQRIYDHSEIKDTV